MKSGRRAAALLEVFGVYLAGELLAVVSVRLLGIKATSPLTHFTADISDAELLRATRQMFIATLFQYACYFVLIAPINWWHRRRGAAAYGLTRGGRPWTALLLAGAATAAIATWPVLTVNLAHMVWRFGETVPWRQAYFDTSWRRWEFWLFSAVASFAVIPVCEELFFRGYCQRRLAEDWGDGAAIAGASSLFVFSHSQYIMADAYNMAMVVTLLLSAVGFGVVFAWTRSIVPSIVAHAIFNLPMRPGWTTLIIGAFVIGALLLARSAVAVARRVFSSARVPVLLALGVIGAVFGVAADRVPVLSFAGIGMVLTAVAIETRDRHAKPLPTNAAA